MQLRDLDQWPPLCVAWGSNRLMPDLSTATITYVRVKGKSQITLSIDDRGKGYTCAFKVDDVALARRVALTLKNAIGKTVQDAGALEVLD